MTCPVRTVTRAVERRPDKLAPAGGMYLTLYCGHERWIAGMTSAPEMIPCTQSPCYQGDRYMGD